MPNLLSADRKSPLLATCVLLGACLMITAAIVKYGPGSDAFAAPATKPKSVVLGASGPMPAPRCPEKCLGVATVTGFQSKLNGMSSPYRVPFDGKITAWKLGLGKPTRSQREFFAGKFGERPTAGLAILKKVKVAGKVRYLLRKRTPVQGLNRGFGTTATYRLGRPLKVNRGNFVALTVPTWAPVMAMPDGLIRADNSWRASRAGGTCRETITPMTSRPQQKIGSKREYGCRFDGEQLLYRVKVVRR